MRQAAVHRSSGRRGRAKAVPRARRAPFGHIEHADALVIDLDPGADVSWDFVVASALRMRDIMEDDGLKPWPKLTGGKGIHVVAPLERAMTHDAAHVYARRLAQRLVGTAPDRFVTSAALARRPGKLFVDYLRNGRGTTAVGTYSPRARPGFPIAAPVTWRQITPSPLGSSRK